MHECMAGPGKKYGRGKRDKFIALISELKLHAYVVQQGERDPHEAGDKHGRVLVAVGVQHVLQIPQVPDAPVQVGEAVLIGKVSGQQDPSGLGVNTGVGGQVDDGATGELNRLAV